MVLHFYTLRQILGGLKQEVEIRWQYGEDQKCKQILTRNRRRCRWVDDFKMDLREIQMRMRTLDSSTSVKRSDGGILCM